MSFSKNKYLLVRKAVSYELANFIFNYFLMSRDVAKFLLQNKLIEHKHYGLIGHWLDTQVPNTYCQYANPVMETLLVKLLPLVQNKTKLKLIPTYSFARIYKKGDILHKHTDRDSCQISITIPVGGNEWDFYLEGTLIKLKVGDMLIYKGCEVNHWRNAFKGDICGQVFLHYNNINGPFKTKNAYDGRALLGTPQIKL